MSHVWDIEHRRLRWRATNQAELRGVPAVETKVVWGLGSESVAKLVKLVSVMGECGEEEQSEGRQAKGGVRSLCAKGKKLLFLESQREQTERGVGEVRTDTAGGKRCSVHQARTSK